MLDEVTRGFTEFERSDPNTRLTELPPLKMDAESLAEDFRRYFTHTLGRDKHCRTTHYPYKALLL